MNHFFYRVLLGLLLFITLFIGATGCGSTKLEDVPEVENTISADAPLEADSSFVMVDDESWDDTAVRQVLDVFAFGGFANDAQIQAWADMNPGAAIVQMLTLDTTNPLLSPTDDYDQLSSYDLSLSGLTYLWSTNSADNKMQSDQRASYGTFAWDSPARTWFQAVTKRGANPVRQRVGLFETNYHMAVNEDVGVGNLQVYTYYDDILNGLAANSLYQNIIATAALSSAVATQYNHKENLFIDARFQGNEDFAREFHQLFFGILATDETDYHEITTIKNTAKALTDMSVDYITDSSRSYLSDEVVFGTEYHYPGSLEILHETIDGTTAEEKITSLAQMTIQHEDSLDNLPIIIVQHFADDNLDEEKIAAIRTIWNGMSEKNLLAFLRKYAISTAFHNPTRVKYWSSIERNLLTANKITLNNEESYLGYYSPQSYVSAEDVSVFRPTHNVFGNQSGLEASDSGSVFKTAYNKAVNNTWYFSRYQNSEDQWKKDWASVIPDDGSGDYRVQSVAEWLWQKYCGDGLKNFGTLERAQVYALLGSGKDFGLFVDTADPLHVYTAEEIETDATLNALFDDMAIAKMNLNSSDETKNYAANYRVGLATAFISATPYVFAQQGR